MSPIKPRQPFSLQLGKSTTLPGGNNIGSDLCSDIVEDNRSKSTYCVGQTLNATGLGDGSKDAFIMKLDRDGRVVWAKQFGSPEGRTESCTNAGVDKYGNIYCSGLTRGMMTTTVTRIDTMSPRSSSDEDRDALVIKLNPDGDVIWIKQFGTSAEDSCGNIAVAPNGNAYCGGTTYGTLGDDPLGNPDMHEVVIDPGTGEDINADSFIAKLNPKGEIVWKRQIGTFYYPEASPFSDQCAGVAIDLNENVFCTGTTTTSLFETNSDGPGGENYDVFIWGLDRNGDRHLEIQIGQETMTNDSRILDSTTTDLAYDVATDKDGNIYVVGFTYAGFIQASADGSADPIILKYSHSGNLIWAVQGLYSGVQVLNRVTVDNSGKVYVLGTTDRSTFAKTDGSTDIFVGCLNADGSLAWTEQYGTNLGFLAGGNETALGIDLDSSGNIYIGGYTLGNYVEENASPGASDLFVLRLRNNGLPAN